MEQALFINTEFCSLTTSAGQLSVTAIVLTKRKGNPCFSSRNKT